MIIAIDGPAASGKGTLARRLATAYGLPHLDTGLIYRAVAKALLDAGRAPDDEAAATAAAQALDPRTFDENALKTPAITEAASVVAAIAQVRQAPCSTAATSAPSLPPTPTSSCSWWRRRKSVPGAGFSSCAAAASPPTKT